MIVVMEFPPGITSFPLPPPATVVRGTPALTPLPQGAIFPAGTVGNIAAIDTSVVPLQMLRDAGFTFLDGTGRAEPATVSATLVQPFAVPSS
jgi:hypothetical protein